MWTHKMTRITAQNVFFNQRKIDYRIIWKNFVIVKLKVELNALVMHEQLIFMQFWTSYIGGVLHAPIFDKLI